MDADEAIQVCKDGEKWRMGTRLDNRPGNDQSEPVQMNQRVSSLILKHTRITREHLTPELALRLITRDSELWSSRIEDVPFDNDPFWGFYWPGGQAIARYILNKEICLQNKKVLDVGCGCGAVSTAAGMVGARVVANDIDTNAVIATQINAKINNIEVNTSTDNYIGSNCTNFDVILIGDMFYDEEFALKLFNWLRSLASNGKMVLIGDPGRHALCATRKQYLTLLASYVLQENTCLENRGFRDTTVWKLNNY